MACEVLTIGGVSDQGCVRENNEDFYGYVETAALRVVMVCDGMGGAAGGEVASRTAVDTMREVFTKDSESLPTKLISKAIAAANTAVHERAMQQQELRGMGTTCVLVAVDNDNMVYVAHVGDSRCYYLPVRGTLVTATKDHSRVQEMVDAGWVTPEDAKTSDARHVITRALGIRPEVEAEIQGPLQVNAGDKLLLCTDGLSDMLKDATIALLLAPHDSQRACEELVRAANERGGHDNITVSVVTFGAASKRSVSAWLSVRERVTEVAGITTNLQAHPKCQYGLWYLLGVAILVFTGASYLAVLNPMFRRQREAMAAEAARKTETVVCGRISASATDGITWLAVASNAVYQAYPSGRMPPQVVARLKLRCGQIVSNMCAHFQYGGAMAFIRCIQTVFPQPAFAAGCHKLEREVAVEAWECADVTFSNVNANVEIGMLADAIVRIEMLHRSLTGGPSDFWAVALQKIRAAGNVIEQKRAYVDAAPFAILDTASSLRFVCSSGWSCASGSSSGLYARICPASIFPWRNPTRASEPRDIAAIAAAIKRHVEVHPFAHIKPAPSGLKPTINFPQDFLSEEQLRAITQTSGALRQQEASGVTNLGPAAELGKAPAAYSTSNAPIHHPDATSNAPRL